LRRIKISVTTPNVKKTRRWNQHGRLRAPAHLPDPWHEILRNKTAHVPSELIAAIPAAARAPVRNFDGRVQKHGSSKYSTAHQDSAQ